MPTGPDQLPSGSGKIPVADNKKNLCSLNSDYNNCCQVSSLCSFLHIFLPPVLESNSPEPPHVDLAPEH